jgi:DNA-binding MarR family transcriptional regulator
MVPISQIFEKASTALGLPVLTPEYEIVLALMDRPGLTADQLFDRSSLSRAGFFNTIERLKMWGILISQPGVDDRRHRIYRLSGDLRQLIFYRFRKYRVDYLEYRLGEIAESAFVTKDLTARRDKGLDYFGCQFKILFYLFLKPNSSNNTLQMLLDASRTKFHVILRTLLADRLVTSLTDRCDKRVKLYNISPPARLAMKDLHLALFEWLDLHEDEYAPPSLSSDANTTHSRCKQSP